MPGGEQQSARQRQLQRLHEAQRRRSWELDQQRQQLWRLALANCHNRWFQQFVQRPEAGRMFERWCREYDGFEEFMTHALTADLDD